jgi:hypothetical protein
MFINMCIKKHICRMRLESQSFSPLKAHLKLRSRFPFLLSLFLWTQLVLLNWLFVFSQGFRLLQLFLADPLPEQQAWQALRLMV